MVELVQPRRRVNSIIYDVHDDAGRLEHTVVRVVDNSSEKNRLLAMWPHIVVPDTDRHIVCCRCTKDFGITISSETILTNMFLRKIKAGCGPHNTYLQHLESGECTVEPGGIAVDKQLLIAAAKQPKRLTRAAKVLCDRDTVRAIIVIRHFLGEYNGAEDINWRVQAALRRTYTK